MAANWKQTLSEIDTVTDHVVHGYSREIEKLLSKDDESVTIAPLIIYTILMYYWMNEYFDEMNQRKISLSDKKLTITSLIDGWKNTTFGKTSIASTRPIINEFLSRIL